MMTKKTVSPKVIIILGFIFFVVVAVSVRAATTVGVNVSVEGTLTGTGAATFTLAGNENLALTNTTATTDTIAVTSTSADNSGVQTSFTLGNNTAADTVGAFEANVTSANTGDADYVTGVLINNVSSADATVNEYGIYQKGAGWDYGLFTEDGVVNVLPATGGVNIIGNGAYTAQGIAAAVDRTDSESAAFDVDVRGVTFTAARIQGTLSDDADATDIPSVFSTTLTNNSGDADETIVTEIRYANGSATSVAANSKILSLDQNDGDITFPYGLMVTTGGGGGDDTGNNQLTVAIDVSDVDLNNAIDIGKNFLKTTNLRLFESSSSTPNTITLEETSGGNDLMTFAYNSSSGKGDVAVTGAFGIGGGTAIAKHISGTATNMTSANIAATACADYGTITVTGAAVGDTVYASPNADSSSSGIEDSSLSWNAVVTSSGTVTIRACNPTGSGINAGDDQEWRADVWQH